MKKNAMIVLTELRKSNIDCPPTTRELYEDMSDADQAMFEDVETLRTLRKLLVNMKAKGLVENGISEIVGGRILLTWVITSAGIKALDDADKFGVIGGELAPMPINNDDDLKTVMLETMKKLNAVINECIEKLEGVPCK